MAVVAGVCDSVVDAVCGNVSAGAGARLQAASTKTEAISAACRRMASVRMDDPRTLARHVRGSTCAQIAMKWQAPPAITNRCHTECEYGHERRM